MSKCNSDSGDAHILYNSLCNEIRLDQRYREIFEVKGFYINYKIMKQIALKSKFGFLVTPVFFILAWVMPAIIFLRWILMLGISLGAPASPALKRDVTSVWIIPTSPSNEVLIRSALARGKRTNIHTLILSNMWTNLTSRLGMNAVMAIGWQALCLIIRIIFFGTNRTALLLHSRDAMSLLVLAKFARSHPNDLFVTDCHYQRLSFILSHTANELVLVQHGFLDSAIGLPFKGGTVMQVIVRDNASAKGWGQYYRSIQKYTINMQKLDLDANPYSHDAVFLASSFPMIDMEISFIHALRLSASIPIIVKLHPSHLYDNRRSQLTIFADYVCRPDENPSCAVFVSHSSSMETTYQQNGIPTVSLQRESTTDSAIAAVMNALRT
jgi:hypothetical protein